MAPRSFAWQAWHFLHLHRCQRKLGDILGLMWRRGLWRGRRDTFNTCGSLRFLYLHRRQRKLGDILGLMWRRGLLRGRHRCQRKLGDILGLMWRRGLLRGRRVTFNTSGSICVAGVVLSVPPWMSAEAWRHSGTDVAPRSFAWQACHFQHLSPQAQPWYCLYLHRCHFLLSFRGTRDMCIRIYVCIVCPYVCI